MEEEKVIKRCPMSMFGLCKQLTCKHGKVVGHDIEDSCQSHEHHCGVKIGCSTIDPSRGLIIDAEAIDDFIFRFIGPKCSWYAFYIAMLKRIKDSGLVVTPRDEDLHLVIDAKNILDNSIENYKIAQIERNVVEWIKNNEAVTFDKLNGQFSLWSLRDYGQSRSELLGFLGIMEQKNLIVRARKGGKDKPDSFVYHVVCTSCGKSHKSQKGFDNCVERQREYEKRWK